MKPPFPYYGGKSKMQHKIQKLIPQYKIYAEPFAGSAATLFNLENYHNKVEILNDLNKELISFYRTVKDKILFPRLLKMVEGTLHSEAEYRRALDIYLDSNGHSSIFRAWAVWVSFTQSHACNPHRGGGWRFQIKETRAFNKEAFFIYNSKKNFQKLAGRLERVSLRCMDALKFIKRVDSLDTFFFIDPPYPGCDQGNFEKMGFKMPQFIKLLELLESIKGKFLLTSGFYPELEAARSKNNWYSKDFLFKNSINFYNGKENEPRIKKRIEAMTWNYQEPNGRLF